MLGRLNPAGLLNGALPLDEHAARGVLQRDVAGPLELEVETAALGTTQVAVAHIARAIRATASAGRIRATSPCALMAALGRCWRRQLPARWNVGLWLYRTLPERCARAAS